MYNENNSESNKTGWLRNKGNGDSEKPPPYYTFIDKSSRENVDFDDLLPYVGSFGTYQIILFLLMAPYTVFYVFVYFTQIFITLIPNDYWCNVPELRHLEPSDR